ncbi:hypothetical protein DB346_15270 [Verrucomicrobia bacterium LW23]|nr:hypothetical protein DB346_15270 [Verrucomicrobia bacterium LW23]
MNVRYRAGRAGFSIVELLMVTAILSVLTLVLVQMVTGVSKLWKSGHERADMYQTGRAVLEMIGREVQQAEARPPNIMNSVKERFASTPLVINPPLPASAQPLKDSSNVPMDSLFFYAPLQVTGKGALVSIGFFVNTNHELCRLSVDSANTTYPKMAAGNFNDPSNVNNYLYNTYETAQRTLKESAFMKPVAWLLDASSQPAFTDPAAVSVVANRIIGFIVRGIDRNGNPLPSSLLPSTAPVYSAGSVNVNRSFLSAWWPVSDELPSAIEVTLIIAEPSGYLRLKQSGQLPVLKVPASNSDADIQAALTDIKARLLNKMDNYVIVTKKFPLARGTR